MLFTLASSILSDSLAKFALYIKILAGTRNNVAVMILFYRSCLFNLCSVTTSTQNPTATGENG